MASVEQVIDIDNKKLKCIAIEHFSGPYKNH